MNTSRLVVAIGLSVAIHALVLGVISIIITEAMPNDISLPMRIAVRMQLESETPLLDDGDAQQSIVSPIPPAAVTESFDLREESKRTRTASTGAEQSSVMASTLDSDSKPVAPVRPTGITEPEPREPIVPAYPAIARRTGLEGTVILDVDIDHHGIPAAFHVLEPRSHRLLEEAAIDAAMRARYKPGTENDVPIRAVIRVRVTFHLDD